MAGHSKWANIKHRKGAQDKKKAKEFTRALKDISVAVKEGGGGDPETNPTLRNAIANAKGINMPKDNIQRAIKKASGDDADDYQNVSFEGYGPHGIAMFIECTTDNQNRTVASVRSIFTKNDGSLGKNGSIDYLFEKKGVFVIDKSAVEQDLEELELELIEGGATEIQFDDELIYVYTEFTDFGMMSSKLEELEVETKNADIHRIPLNTINLEQQDAFKILDLIDKFEDDDDVKNVYHNMEITDELMAAYQEQP
jgi:YebC/PmpR family DNA-binding regulatory protein